MESAQADEYVAAPKLWTVDPDVYSCDQWVEERPDVELFACHLQRAMRRKDSEADVLAAEVRVLIFRKEQWTEPLKVSRSRPGIMGMHR